ncbi:MAG: hypothetical protein IAF94_11520 [Pirellulaceae bacterium]|nr:hypothetical protein [Pirellulaceae bacterium]
MRRYIRFGVLAVLVFAAQVVWAQGNPRTRELQAQLEEIQQKLRLAARSDDPNSKVTELGSSRNRVHELEVPRLVIRLYDLSDLFAVAPPYVAREGGELGQDTSEVFSGDGPAASAAGPNGGGGMGGGGGLFDVPDSIDKASATAKGTHPQFGSKPGSGAGASSGPRTSMDGLIEVITSTISQDSWDTVGGPASIASIGASLLISADAETHDKISSLLDLFRKRWGTLRTVSVRAHWLWLSESQVSDALAAEQKEAGLGSPYGVLSDGTWKKLLAAAAEGKKRTPYHAMLTCHNGQTVFTRAGGERLVVSGVTPIAGKTEKEQALYQPVVRSIQEGAALQVTPVVTRNAKFVVLDVHSRVNLLGETPKPIVKDEARAAASPIEQVIAAIDRPALQTQRLATTLRIPVGRPALIGGMTFATDGDGPANLYLFVTASVQELRDDEGLQVKPDEKPIAGEAKEDVADDVKDPGKTSDKK